MTEHTFSIYKKIISFQVELYFKAMTNGDYVSVNLHHPDWDVPGGFFGSEANVSPKLERNLRKPLFDMYSIETKKVTRYLKTVSFHLENVLL